MNQSGQQYSGHPACLLRMNSLILHFIIQHKYDKPFGPYRSLNFICTGTKRVYNKGTVAVKRQVP